MKNLIIVQNKSEFGAGTRGSSLGIDALKFAAFDAGYETYFNIKKVKIEGQINKLTKKFRFKYAKRIDEIINTYKKVDKSLSKFLDKNHFPIFFSGDHSYSPSYINSLRKIHNYKNIGIVWIDAHTDLHSPYTTPSGNMHGMSLAIAIGDDNKEFQRNALDQPAIEKWNSLKKLIKKNLINPKNIVFIGTRDKEPEEEAILKKYKITEISVKDIRKDFDKSMKLIESKLVDLDAVFVSFDVDCLDPEKVSPGTGTPVKNGFKLSEASKIVAKLAKLKNICGFEMVEINPLLDNNKNSMATAALNILQNFINNYQK